MKKKETVGKIAVDLMAKPENQHTVIDQMRENLTDYDNNIFLCVQRYKKIFPGDFYVVVETKKERLFELPFSYILKLSHITRLFH